MNFPMGKKRIVKCLNKYIEGWFSRSGYSKVTLFARELKFKLLIERINEESKTSIIYFLLLKIEPHSETFTTKLPEYLEIKKQV